MALTMLIVDQGEGIFLANALNKTAPQNLVLRLFTNDYTVVDGTVETDLAEATFDGYAAVTLAGAGWTITPGAPTIAVFALQAFARTVTGTTQNVYGAYLTQLTSGLLVAAGRLSDAPFPFTNVNDTLQINPQMTYKKAGE